LQTKLTAYTVAVRKTHAGLAGLSGDVHNRRMDTSHRAVMENASSMNESLDKIASFLKDRSRLSFPGQKRGVLRQRLEARLEQLQLPDFSAYWDLLLCNPAEERHLFELATTNETSFFRNAAQFTYLKERIVPSLVIRSSQEMRSFRILSAGCSTGEEPYSIAMTLLDSFSPDAGLPPQIIAGDLNEKCLGIAREGWYAEERLARLPDGYRQRFMTAAAGGAVVGDGLKGIVRFTRLNLNNLMNSDSPAWSQGLGLFDIIFCRNVMIYFAPLCQQKLIDTLYRLLQPGGYLFTGDAEPLHLFSHEFKPVAEANCLIYQKTE
jgi:chemotaxis protein methyltransferase CheR